MRLWWGFLGAKGARPKNGWENGKIAMKNMGTGEERVHQSFGKLKAGNLGNCKKNFNKMRQNVSKKVLRRANWFCCIPFYGLFSRAVHFLDGSGRLIVVPVWAIARIILPSGPAPTRSVALRSRANRASDAMLEVEMEHSSVKSRSQAWIFPHQSRWKREVNFIAT